MDSKHRLILCVYLLFAMLAVSFLIYAVTRIDVKQDLPLNYTRQLSCNHDWKLVDVMDCGNQLYLDVNGILEVGDKIVGGTYKCSKCGALDFKSPNKEQIKVLDEMGIKYDYFGLRPVSRDD